MSNDVAVSSVVPLPAVVDSEQQALSALILRGDLSRLKEADRVTYYLSLCKSLDLNPAATPFDYLELNGKLVLYARKSCTDMLASNRGISREIIGREEKERVYSVTVRGTLPDGRTDTATGSVAMWNPKTTQAQTPEERANSIMKAETKAKRRVVLSLCGLGVLDEAELDTVPQARVRNNTAQIQAELTAIISEEDVQHLVELATSRGQTPDVAHYRTLSRFMAMKIAKNLESLPLVTVGVN